MAWQRLDHYAELQIIRHRLTPRLAADASSDTAFPVDEGATEHRLDQPAGEQFRGDER